MTKLTNVVESVLRESVVEDAAELVGIEKEEAADRISGLSFANYLELGNAVDLEDAETAREILGSASPIEEDWKKAAAIGTMAIGLGAAAVDQGPHATSADDPSWDAPHDVQMSTQRSVDQDDNLIDRSLSVKGPNADGEYLVTYLDGEEVKRYVTKTPPKDGNPRQLGEVFVDEEKLLDKPTPTLKDLAKKHDMSLGDIGSQLAKGIKAEKEHTSDMLIAKEIALDHLNELPDYYDRLEKVEEADNPYAAPKAAAAPPAAIPPSAASSIDALAQPDATANDVDNENNQRKEVDDLSIGDDIEVIDISGDPTAVTVKNPRGPGETLIVQTDKGEEHMIKKLAVSGTPALHEGFDSESLSEEDEIALEAALIQEDASPRISDEHFIEEELGENGWIMYINWGRDDLDYIMYKNTDRDTNREYRFLVINKETGSWTMHKSKRTDAPAVESGDAPELIHVIRGIANSTMEEGQNARKTEHSGAKKGKGAYYGQKKTAKRDSNKKRRENDKQAISEDESFFFFLDPDGRGDGATVMSSKGDIHDHYDDSETAMQEVRRLNAEFGKDNDGNPIGVNESVLSDHVKVEYSDPEGRYIIVTAGNAGYWTVGKDNYYNKFDRTSHNNLEDAMRDAEETAAGLGEGKYDYNKRDKGKGAGTSSPMYDGGAENRKNRKAFRKAEKAKAHQARMRGEVDEDISRIRELAGLAEAGSGGGTGAGAIASAPAAMNGIQSRNQSIYGKTNKKPKPKQRAKESTEDGIGRNKK